jgi:anti-sigma regulatory factor (Ser/Thr protein kinase)
LTGSPFDGFGSARRPRHPIYFGGAVAQGRRLITEESMGVTEQSMRATRQFEPDPAEVRGARRFVADFLESCGMGSGDVGLLVSELATNAVLHARSPFQVTVIHQGARLRVEVSDENSRLPSFSVVPSDASSGRGLTLVQSLAGAWGVDAHLESGKTIWFEVALGS